MVAGVALHGPTRRESTVLVVDNESVMRRFVRRSLEAKHFHVEEARDGESISPCLALTGGRFRKR